MTQVAISVILCTAAVATFMLNGRQWPTFVVTLLFGLYLGHTSLGEWIMSWVDKFFGWINGLLA